MAKAPSMQFYPGDWQRDTALKMCSLAARGLWVEMMWLMFDGEPYGHLSVNGSVIPPVKLAVILGVDREECESLLAELEKFGVFSRTDEGCIYSRRMVNDRKRRETNALNGSKGGNPRLSKSVNPKVNPLRAVADADSITQGRKERASTDEHFEAFYASYPNKKSRGDAEKAWTKLSASDRALCKPAIEAQVKAHHFRGADGIDYIPHPATWLNAKRWLDTIADRPMPQPKRTGPMTQSEAREIIKGIRERLGIGPGDVLETHHIPQEVREAMSRP